MTLQELGAYIRLLCLCWLERSLPVEMDALARLCRVSPACFTRLWPALQPCFTVVDGRLIQKRIEIERHKQETWRALKVAAGTKGGRAKARKQKASRKVAVLDSASSTTLAKASPPSSSSSSSSSSVSDLQSTNVRTRARDLDVIPDEDPQLRRAGKLLERYGELFQEHRRGARYHNRMHLDFPKACELVKTWADDARLEKLAVLILTTDDEWISNTDRGFAVFALKATWADDKLRAWEIETGVTA